MATTSDTFVSEVLQLTNQFRAENGLAPLTANSELDQTAQSYSETMAKGDFFDHTGKDGSKPWDRAEKEGYTARAMGENIAAGQRSPQSVVDGWINSPGHRANLLNPSYTELGVGYFNLENDTGSVNYNTYWTQLFGSGDLTPSATNPPNSPEVLTPTAEPAPVAAELPTEKEDPVKTSPEEVPETPEEPAPLPEPAAEAPAEPMAEAPAEPAAEPTVETPTEPVAETPAAEPMAETPTEPVAETPAAEPATDNPMGESPMDAGNMDDMDMGEMPHSKDHMALENLIDTLAPTHIAAKSGAWSDPTTWQNGTVPGNGAKVLISEGATVTYDQISDDRINTIAIEGNLRFAAGKDTQLYVETILNAPEGKLDIGSESQAIAADKNARIIFTSNNTVNTQWDPTQLSKGLVSHGEVNIYGADKLDKAVLAGDAQAGNNVLTFQSDLTGWQVGDQIVLAGTDNTWNGTDADNSRLQDEVLTITDISGKEIRFENKDITEGDNTVLRFDHTTSNRADPGELNLYAANLTRNVSFETENGKDVPINQRAHVMLMHNPNVNVLNAGFYDLGRSDKSKIVDDIGENVDGSKGNGTNIRGRYSLHLHKTGVDDVNGEASILKGNVVSGSPGWGIVQHQSHAGLEDNTVFDTVGAGIVAESGNEIGWWTDNFVVKTTGMGWEKARDQRDNRENKFDLGFEGDAYWVQGAAQVKNRDNKAASSNRAGMVLFGSALDTKDTFREVTTIPVKNLPKELQGLWTEEQTEADIRDVPMATVSGFESYNADFGLRVWGHNTNFDGEGAFSTPTKEGEPKVAHTGRSLIEDFKLWGNRWSGAQVFYSSNVDLKDGLVLGRETTPYIEGAGGQGLLSNHATFNSTYDNLTIAGYEQGAQIEYPNTDKDFIGVTLKNSTFNDNVYALGKVGDDGIKEGRPDDFGSFIKLQNNTFESSDETTANNRAPVARFRSKAAGGLAIELDASASSDPDPLQAEDGPIKDLLSNGIAAYGWDLDSDGTIDKFGRNIKHVFDQAGSRDITLTVFDNQGQSTSQAQTIDVQPAAYGNAFLDGGFNNQPELKSWQAFSEYSDQGWFISDQGSITGGVAKLSSTNSWGNHLGQVVRDQKVRRGEQTLSFRLKNLEGSTEAEYWKNNETNVTLWGVNGQFGNEPWQPEGPQQLGTLPMQRTELASEMYGGEEGEFFDWKNISLDVDLGQGYDYLLFQVNATHVKDAGDDVSIDNVSLTGAPNSIPGAPTTSAPTFSPSPDKKEAPVNQPDQEPVAEAPVVEAPVAEAPTSEPTVVPDEDPTGEMPEAIAQLSFEEAIDNIAQDTSTGGTDNFGRLIADAELVEGKVGQAVAFDGVRDMVAIGNSEDINLGIHPERSISLWFQADDTSANSKQVIYEEGGGARGLNLYLADDLLYFGGWNAPESGWEGS